MKDLGPASQKDIFDFTTLEGDYHLTVSWCCMNNSKSSIFMGPNVLRASACNGSLVSELFKSSNLTGKNSYCILTTGHHKCILTKYTTGLGKLYNSTFLPPCLYLLPAALMSLTTCFQETPPRHRLTPPKVFYALRKDIFLLEGHGKRTRYAGCHVYQTILEEIAQLIPNPEHSSFWNNTIIQQTEFSQ
jgi:hypothetical protein